MSNHNTCSICLDDILDTDTVMQVKCDHRFHEHCIKTWFRKGRNTCPFCRMRLGPDLETDMFGQPLSGDQPSSGQPSNTVPIEDIIAVALSRRYRVSRIVIISRNRIAPVTADEEDVVMTNDELRVNWNQELTNLLAFRNNRRVQQIPEHVHIQVAPASVIQETPVSTSHLPETSRPLLSRLLSVFIWCK